MEKMLICQNRHCRFLLDLSQGGKDVARTSLVLNGCPECGHAWSSNCPACSAPLSIAWSGHHAHCAACHEPLRPQKARAQARAAAA